MRLEKKFDSGLHEAMGEEQLCGFQTLLYLLESHIVVCHLWEVGERVQVKVEGVKGLVPAVEIPIYCQ
jgi:hypothetical protein